MSKAPAAINPEATEHVSAKGQKRRKTNASAPLLFIDTNILLDFYRARNDAGISLLSKVDALHAQTITTCQVEMEFKKNRQKVISETVTSMKAPDFNLLTPGFLTDAATVKVIKNRIQDVKKRVEKLKARILSTLENPKTHDRIYQATQRLFNNSSPLNLRYDTKEYRQVWRKALRRFLEGRPPRKKEDTSAGDAINWEWILYCITQTNRDVIIVSRDADYGLTLDSKGYANNWLTEEVKQRVNQQRKLILVDRLSAALKLMDVKVTREEITSERAIIKTSSSSHQSEIESLVGNALDDLVDGEEMGSLIAETNACGWRCDTYDLEKIKFKDGKWTAHVSFSFIGDQEDDKPWCGDTISGHCAVEIGPEKLAILSDVKADVERDTGEEETGYATSEGGKPDEHKT